MLLRNSAIISDVQLSTAWRRWNMDFLWTTHRNTIHGNTIQRNTTVRNTTHRNTTHKYNTQKNTTHWNITQRNTTDRYTTHSNTTHKYNIQKYNTHTHTHTHTHRNTKHKRTTHRNTTHVNTTHRNTTNSSKGRWLSRVFLTGKCRCCYMRCWRHHLWPLATRAQYFHSATLCSLNPALSPQQSTCAHFCTHIHSVIIWNPGVLSVQKAFYGAIIVSFCCNHSTVLLVTLSNWVMTPSSGHLSTCGYSLQARDNFCTGNGSYVRAVCFIVSTARFSWDITPRRLLNS